MKINILSDAKLICSNRTSFQNYFAWSTVARLPGGELGLACSGYRIKHICPFGKSVISYSRDEGETWTLPAPVIDTPLDDRDGGIATNGKDVIVTTFNNTVAMQRKWNEEAKVQNDDHIRSAGNNGLFENSVDTIYNFVGSYLDNVNAQDAEEKFLGSLYRVSHDGGYTFGEIKKLPITAPHGPCAFPDGRFIYVGTEFDTKNGNDNNIACYITNENGEFEFVSRIDNLDPIDGDEVNVCEPHTIVLPNGKIVVHIRVQSKVANSIHSSIFTTYQCESFDEGKTFTHPHPIFEDRRFGSPPHLMLHSSGVLISSIGFRDNPYGVRIIASKDMGETWQDLGFIYTNNGVSADIGYPSSVELKDGSILTAFYAHEKKGSPSEIFKIVWKLED